MDYLLDGSLFISFGFRLLCQGEGNGSRIYFFGGLVFSRDFGVNFWLTYKRRNMCTSMDVHTLLKEVFGYCSAIGQYYDYIS